MEAEERPSKLRKLSHSNDDVINFTPDENLTPGKSEAGQNAKVHLANDVHAQASTENVIHDGLDDTLQDAQIAAQTPVLDAPSPLLSKNQLKKLKRKQEWEAGREDRKFKRKEKTKEKKARKRAARDEAVKVHAQTEYEATLRGNDAPFPKVRGGLPPRPRRQLLPIALVIDCSFDKLMAEKEMISLGSQLTRAYSDNSKAPFQAHLYVSSWTKDSELRKRFDGLLKGMYRNWKGVFFTEEDFVTASEMAERAMSEKKGGSLVGAFEKYIPKVRVEKGEGIVQRKNSGEAEEPAERHNHASRTSLPVLESLQEAAEVIYLTSDSPNTLSELKPYHTYIIGGLVDKNRHKGICLKTALDKNAQLQAESSALPIRGASHVPPADKTSQTASKKPREIKTAKLPIGEYMSMTARHVLATNHVVEIMLKWLETSDWGEAFLSVMPKRKGGVLKNSHTSSTDRLVGANGTKNADERESEDDEREGEAVDDQDGPDDLKADNPAAEDDTAPL